MRKSVTVEVEGGFIKNINPNNLNTVPNELTWNVTKKSGDRVEEGLYFIPLFSGIFNETKKLLVLRD